MSRSPSPGGSEEEVEEVEAEQTEKGSQCLWGETCRVVLGSKDELGDHVNSVHVIEDRPKYSCKWVGCERRGQPQASKFALMVHCRSHTGQRPFVCNQGDCMKAFTRADALHKHQRAHHGMDIPMPGRGGNRKRKYTTREQQARDATSSNAAPADPDPQAIPSHRLPPSSTPAHHDHQRPGPSRRESHRSEPSHYAQQHQPQHQPQQHQQQQHQQYRDHAPVNVQQHYPPASPLPQHLPLRPDVGQYKALYLIEKAKLSFAEQQHQALLEEYDNIQREEASVLRDKELMLDEVLKANFGSVSSP